MRRTAPFPLPSLPSFRALVIASTVACAVAAALLAGMGEFASLQRWRVKEWWTR